MVQPRLISHFEVLSELGRGGMGVVYKVKDLRNGAHAALKMIPPDVLARPDSALRFKREFRAMRRVEHPNVIRVFEQGTHEGCPFFTMELVDGREIRKFLDGDTPIVPSEKDGPPNAVFTVEQRRRLNEPARVRKVADLIVQVAYALREIHNHRIVHRDLKPDNIIISKAGIAKLMDFGIAKQLSANSEQSSGGMVVGTFKYLSPEQALGVDIDGRADLYCLGIIFYELLAGRHPFYSENSVGYAFHHARKPPPPMEKFNPEIHRGLKAICEKLIKKEPRERYATAQDVINAIRAAVDDDPALAVGASDSISVEAAGDSLVKPGQVGVGGRSGGLALAGGANLESFDPANDPLFQPSFVGRSIELKRLAATTEQLPKGRSDLVVVSGAPGMGKSRLIREAAAAATEARVSFVVGRCIEHGAGYKPFVEIVEAIIEEKRSRPADVGRLLGEEGRVLARYVPALQTLDGSVRPRPAPALEPQGERLRLFQAMTAFLERASVYAPRVLVLDNVHLADELSFGLIEHVLEQVVWRDPEGASSRRPPLALVLTLDPTHARASAAARLVERQTVASERSGSATTLVLKPLSTSDVREFLVSMLGGSEVGKELVDYLHTETAGVPGAIEEHVRSWHESGRLVRRTGKNGQAQWVFVREASTGAGAELREPVVDVRDVTRLEIPAAGDADRANNRRIARLTPLARDVAERIAVVGDQVGGALLERVALRHEEELLDALNELVSRSILADEQDDGIYRFIDKDDRQALLLKLPSERSQQLHHFVARVLVDEARRERRSPNPEELAAHYVEAGEPLQAIEQLMVAARNALSASATQTAAQHVRDAQELLATEQRTAEQLNATPSAVFVRIDLELVLLRLDVLAAVNEHKECVALAKRRLPRTTGADGRLVSELLLRLATSERMVGELDAALDHTSQVLARTERGGARSLRCRAKSLCGQLYEQRGQFDVAGRYFSDAFELARTIGDELEEERARWAIAARDLVSGDLDGAARAFEQLVHMATARGEKLRVTQYVDALGVIAHEQERIEDAEASFRKVIDTAKPAGDRRTLATGLLHIAALRRDQGRHDDALGLLAKAAKLFTELDQVESLAAVRVVESQVLLDRATSTSPSPTTAEALKKADDALDLGLKANSALTVAEAAICRGLALCRSNDAQGQEDIARGLHAARTLGAHRVLLLALLYGAESAVLLNDRKSAQSLLDEARQAAKQSGAKRWVTAATTLAQRHGLS